MSQKIYFPVDEKLNLFSIASTTEGLVIPLNEFGYRGVHVTFYIKEIPSRPGFKKLSIHITEDLTGNIIKEKFVEFNEKQFEENYGNKFKTLIEKWQENSKKDLTVEPNDSRELYCYDCIGAQSEKNKIHKRKIAAETYKKLFEEWKKGKMLIPAPCENQEHKMLIDSQGELVYQNHGFLVKFGDPDTILERMNSLFEETFPEEIKWIANLRSEFGKALEAYKSEVTSLAEKIENEEKLMKFMLDTNAFNRLVDHNILIEDLDGEFFTTHIPKDELSNTSNPERKQKLFLKFQQLSQNEVPTESFIVDVSRVGMAKLGTGYYFSLLKLLNESKPKEESNNIRDALIGESAISNNFVLVTNDRALKESVKTVSPNTKVLSFEEFLKEMEK